MITSGEFFASKNYGCYNRLADAGFYYISETPYCEKIYIADTPALQLGAILTGTDSEEAIMKIYNGISTSYEVDSCKFLPAENDSCIVDNDEEGFESGDYYVCIDAKKTTNYKIKTEDSGENCGWIDLPISGESDEDFAIFTRRAEYSGARVVSINITDTPELEDFADKANYYLEEKYNSNCLKSAFSY